MRDDLFGAPTTPPARPGLIYIPLVWFGDVPQTYTDLMALFNDAVLFIADKNTLGGFIEAQYAKLHPPAGILGTPFAGTRQELINLFFAAFGRDVYIEKISKAGLTWLYEGGARERRVELPALEDLTLSRVDVQALIMAL